MYLLLCGTNNRGHRRRNPVAVEWYEGHKPVTFICSLLQSTVRSLEEGYFFYEETDDQKYTQDLQLQILRVG
jgi:hypothetical protein